MKLKIVSTFEHMILFSLHTLIYLKKKKWLLRNFAQAVLNIIMSINWLETWGLM